MKTHKNDAGSPDIEEQVKVREAVALFSSDKALDSAILALQESGINRARISVLGHMADPRDVSHGRDWMQHLVNRGSTPQGNPVDPASRAEEESAVVAIPGYAVGAAGLIAVMASGGTLAAAVAAAIVGGGLASGSGFLLARSIARHHVDASATALAEGGLALWVSVGDDEQTVTEQLRKLGGQNVHVIEHAGTWGTANIPLSRDQPDLFLREG